METHGQGKPVDSLTPWREAGGSDSGGVSSHKPEKVGIDFSLGELILPSIFQFGSRYQKLPLIRVAWTFLAS